MRVETTDRQVISLLVCMSDNCLSVACKTTTKKGVGVGSGYAENVHIVKIESVKLTVLRVLTFVLNAGSRCCF